MPVGDNGQYIAPTFVNNNAPALDADEMNGMAGAAAGAVEYDREQFLSATQKTRGRMNISAAAQADVTALQQTVQQLGSQFTFKGATTSALLPQTGNVVNDTYFVTDLGYNETWNGTEWKQSGSPITVDSNLETAGYAADAQKTGNAIADQYSTTSSYDVGDIVLHNGGVYVCTVEIPAAEAWNAAHWSETNVSDEIKNTNTKLDGKLGVSDYSAAAAVGTADNLIDRKEQGTTQNWSGTRTSCGSQSIDDDGYAQIRQITGIGVYGGVKATAIKTIGFNAYNNATGTAALLGGNEYQITGAYTALSYSTGEEITPDGDGLFTPTANGVLTVTGGNATTTCVHLTWSGYRNGEYESYWENTLVLPIAQYFPNGMYASRHDVDVGNNFQSRIDKIEPGKATRWLGIQNIKELTISKHTKENVFVVTGGFADRQMPGSNGASSTVPCFLNSKGWSVVSYNFMTNEDSHEKCISPHTRNTAGCFFEDSDYATYWQNNDIDGLKAAMGDVYVVYTLASAVVTEIDPPLNLQYKVADFGTEEAVGGTFNGTVAYSSDFTRMIVNNHDHIGTLSDLQTTAKNNLVAAINELAARLATLEGGA